MSTRRVVHGAEPPKKRVKLDKNEKGGYRFINADEIRQSLRNQEGLTETLTALRNQFTIKHGEPAVTPQDDRLLLVQSWLQVSPGAQDVFEIWEGGVNERQPSLIVLVVSVISSLLTLLSSHYTYHPLGQPVIKSLLSPPWMRRLNSYIGGSHSELILASLKLLNGMSNFAGGRDRKTILESFAWETKSLPKLLHMRRRTKVEAQIDTLVRPDIRTLYIFFILSFVDPETTSSVKTAFLEQHRDVFLSIFKGLVQDSYSVVQKVLESCWVGLWADAKVKRTIKIGLFNETTLLQIIKLYDRNLQEGENSDHVPADLIHHFLLALCTRPGTGICFRDRGWYPREEERTNQSDDEEEVAQKGGKIYNKILANILKSLKVNEDPRQQELALKIMTACPELVAGYWPAASLTLEPRLSSKWIANISFFGSIISLPVPSVSFLLPNSELYQPSPPPLTKVLENILPSVNTKMHFSKGLQSTSPLVQHSTALALAKSLIKYGEVMHIFQHAKLVLEEDEEDGQWHKRWRDVEREGRRRLPDFQVVVAFSQQLFGHTPTASNAKPNATKAVLLAESAQRLLWLYHRFLPSLVSEARFDVGKLLLSFSDGFSKANQDSVNAVATEHLSGFQTVCQLHVLRLLKESDQFTWSVKMASSPHSYLYILLNVYMVTEFAATRLAVTSLLRHLLAESILFQQDPDEVYLWLAALPKSKRTPGSEAADGARLTDEGASVISFLDDCAQRCLKTPYRYLEEMDAFSRSAEGLVSDAELDTAAVNRPDNYPSGLLMTVLEQLGAKVTNKLLNPSDVLALVSFLRKLIFRLSTKQESLQFLRAITKKVDDLVHPDRLFPDYPVVTSAIRREVSVAYAGLQHSHGTPVAQSVSGNVVVQEFLNHVEQLSIPETAAARHSSAFEFIDWLRLLENPLSLDQVTQLVSLVERIYKPALSELFQHFSPTDMSLWDGAKAVSRFADLKDELDFEWFFIHSSHADIATPACREVLVKLLFVNTPTSLHIRRAICLVAHSLSLEAQQCFDKELILLLTSIMVQARSVFALADITALKEYVFTACGNLKRLSSSDSLDQSVQEGFVSFVEASLDPFSSSDRRLVADLTTYWSNLFRRNIVSHSNTQTAFFTLWIKFMESEPLLDLFDFVCDNIGSLVKFSTLDILEAIMQACGRMHTATAGDPRSENALRSRLAQLLALCLQLPKSSKLEGLIAVALNAHFPMCYNGFPLPPTSLASTSLPLLCSTQWGHLPEELQISSFLFQEVWTDSTAEIVANMLYGQASSKDAFLQWLGTSNSTDISTRHLARVLHAFFDSSGGRLDDFNADGEHLGSHFSRLLAITSDLQTPCDLRKVGGTCICLMLSALGAKGRNIFELAKTHIQALPVGSLTSEILTVGKRLHASIPGGCKDLLTSLVDKGLQWAVRHFSSNTEVDDEEIVIDELAALVKTSSNIKAHLAEPVLTVIIQNCLCNPFALGFMETLAHTTPLKPVVVNRHLQSIIQHPQFFKLCAFPVSTLPSTRNAIVSVLHVLFFLHPANTCQPTHMEPVIRIYGGSLSTTDRKLLSIFQLFETQRKTSLSSMLSRWSSSFSAVSTNSLDAIQNLDPTRVLRTCLHFPGWRRSRDQVNYDQHSEDDQLYDPVFVILLFARMLSDSPPVSASGWVELFRTNVVSLLIRVLSSKDDCIRESALCQISALWKCLDTADLQERPHVIHILDLLRDTLPPPSDDPPRRLPSYTALVLLHALRGVFYPSNFTYPLTARFLLQRPELDTNDVPMLYGMLYSSSDDWKKERIWMIRLLSDGMMSTEDWRVLKRRHTWDLLSSLFQSSQNDRMLRNAILEVLANLTCNVQAATSLTLKSALLTWIEMQLQSPQVDEGVAWIKILENITTVVDPGKLESSTYGEWRSTLCRCCCLLLNNEQTSLTSVFVLAVPVILRLSLLPGKPIPELPSLVERAVACLIRLEGKNVDFSSRNQKSRNEMETPPLPPHNAHRLHEASKGDLPSHVWGKLIEALWRVTMTLPRKHSSWDALTCRLLLWRSIAGEEGSEIGEWARREVVRNLQK